MVDVPTRASQKGLLRESKLNSALSSSRHVPKSLSLVLTLNPDVRAQLHQKIGILRQCHKDAVFIPGESENRDADQR